MGNTEQQIIEFVFTARNEAKKVLKDIEGSYSSIGKVGKNVIRTTSRLNKKTGEMISHYSILNNKLPRFRMEMLSVMFFGMQLQRVFGSMIQPLMDLVGMTDLWNNTLIVLLEPVLMPVIEALIELMSILMSLPEPLKILIGSFVLLGFGLGSVLAWFGQLTLGILGLQMAFPALTAQVGAFATSLGLTGLGVLKFAGIFGGLVGTILLWKYLVQEWVSGSVRMQNVSAGYFSVVIPGIGMIMNNLQLLRNLAREFGGIWTTVWEGLKNTTLSVINGIIGIIQTLINKIKEAVSALSGIGGGIGGMISGVVGAIKGKKQMGGYIGTTGNYMLHAGERVVPSGADIGSVNVNVTTGPIGSGVDISDLARRVSEAVEQDLRRLGAI